MLLAILFANLVFIFVPVLPFWCFFVFVVCERDFFIFSLRVSRGCLWLNFLGQVLFSATVLYRCMACFRDEFVFDVLMAFVSPVVWIQRLFSFGRFVL